MTAPAATTVNTSVCMDEARSLLPIIRANAAESESLGRVAQEVIDAFRATSLPRLLVRKEVGGVGGRLPDAVRVTQVLSSANGGIGWSLSFAIVGCSFGLLLERDAYEEIFQDPEASISGAFSPFSLFADAAEGGYTVTGSSKYNSAHRFASHLFFGGIVRREGQVRMIDGVPEIRGFVVPKSLVSIKPNWPANAMIASESDDAEVSNLFVEERFTFPLGGACPTWVGGAESVIPMLSQLGVGLAAQATGIAHGALGAFLEMAVTKVPAASRTRLADQAGPQIAYAEAHGLWLAADHLVRQTVDEAWARADAGAPFTDLDAANLRSALLAAVALSQRSVELVRAHAGMGVVLRGSEFERFARDTGAVAQHIAVSAARYETVGRVLMGLPAGSPLI